MPSASFDRSTDNDVEQMHTVVSTCASLLQNLWGLEEQHDARIHAFTVLGCFYDICKKKRGKGKEKGYIQNASESLIRT